MKDLELRDGCPGKYTVGLGQVTGSVCVCGGVTSRSDLSISSPASHPNLPATLKTGHKNTNSGVDVFLYRRGGRDLHGPDGRQQIDTEVGSSAGGGREVGGGRNYVAGGLCTQERVLGSHLV